MDRPANSVNSANGSCHTEQVHTNTSSLCSLPTFHRSQVPSVYKEPFIMGGYRKPNASFSECVCYAFVFHNDVWNFWSHFLPLLVWLSWLYSLSHHYDFSEPYYYPLLCFWVGGCSYAMFSSIAHMFGCKSATVRSICFMMDYLGISIYVAGGGIYSFYHELPLSSRVHDYLFPILCLHLLASGVSTSLCSLSRFFWLRHRFLIRAVAFVPATTSSLFPFVLRLITCMSTGEDCISPTLHLHLFSIGITFLVLFFFVSKIPERFAPGKFDIFFQSHTLFHLSAVSLTSLQMYMFPIDCDIRKAALLSKISPSFQTVILPFLVLIVIGLLQVSILGLLVVRGVLIPNKVRPSAHQKRE